MSAITIFASRKSIYSSRGRVNINFALFRYTRAFGDGPRHFEPQSSGEYDILPGTPSPNYHTTLPYTADLQRYWARTHDAPATSLLT
ncbi:hypothetical protein TNCV_2151391 [Trichonephila clavipes]|uniref:Uncharacterized protein n=1 Tax=Trichonephila clavipes TaxID=2585209 RepID=A0A8X6R3X3_TRICX|nr:hypothetical protein TNCV_2151391 [Trichonephila clavipes]